MRERSKGLFAGWLFCKSSGNSFETLSIILALFVECLIDIWFMGKRKHHKQNGQQNCIYDKDKGVGNILET